MLVDAESGELITTYCADINTPTEDGYGYNIKNIEDADYYTEEQAAMIRTVAKNGYWGVKDDASTEELEYGSLEAMKAMMAEAKDENGNPVFTQEEIDGLTDGAAMTATQYAIWTFSNEMSDIEFLNVRYLAKNAETLRGDIGWGAGFLNRYLPEEEEETVDLIFKLYDHLVDMEPTKIEEPTTADTIINEKNFVDDVEVTVIEKVSDHQNNRDNNKKNDVYTTNVSFALVVTPSTENGDDLIVQVIAADGVTVLASGRVAGIKKEGETHQQLTANKDGQYTLEGIEMTEGESNFKLTLEGIQNLKEGVYLYSSEVRQVENEEGVEEDVGSQTLVGVASGDRAVSVEMNITFELDVNDEVVVTERVWRDEHDPQTSSTTVRKTKRVEKETPIPDEDVPLGEEPEEEEFVPAVYRMTRGVGQLETIIDEEVPLAEVPQTGDISAVWFALILMSVCGLCVLHLSDRKCKA